MTSSWSTAIPRQALRASVAAVTLFSRETESTSFCHWSGVVGVLYQYTGNNCQDKIFHGWIEIMYVVDGSIQANYVNLIRGNLL